MTKVIPIVSKKGGVGKTTSSTALAAAAVALGYDVGLIDLDDQASATLSVGLKRAPNVGDVLLGRMPVDEAWVETEHGFRVIPGDITTLTAERQLAADAIGGTTALRAAMSKAESLPEVIFMDTRPDEAHCVLNALAVATEAWIAAEPVPAALEVLPRMFDMIDRVGGLLNEQLGVGAIIPTQVRRTTTHREGEATLRRVYGDLVTIGVPQAVKVAEAHGAKMPVTKYAPLSRAAIAYKEIARALLGTKGEVAA